MVFNSALFFVFFAGVLLVYLSPISAHWRRLFLLLANYAFFASYHPPYVILLAISTAIDWWLANRISASENPVHRKRWLLGSLVLNLGMLVFFKYTLFLVTHLNPMAGTLTWVAPLNAWARHILMPVGISFYTFQALSYTIDVYRKRIPVEPSLVNFALFVSFFPHLVSGPILKARDILPQCQHIHPPSLRQFSWGCHLLLWGLIEKCLLADLLAAPIANAVFDTQSPLSGLDAWSGAMAFTLQIFFDFTGYSTCAIGVALCLGFVIPLNFRFPLGADGFIDFWRRWHISLSSWLRDYLYIPLGGNQHGRWQTHRNTMITMVLGGLWHGANWTFILWGTLHGMIIVLEREMTHYSQQWKLQRWPWLGWLGQQARWLCVPYGLVVSMVMFRSQSVTKALHLVGAMHHPQLLQTPVSFLAWQSMAFITLFFALVVCLHRLCRHTNLEVLFGKLPAAAQIFTTSLLLLALIMYVKGGQPFIYVQF